MYCGCGAHTVALGRAGLLDKILAVELDPRLVQACQWNVELNGLQSLVEVRRGDAGLWAKEEERLQRRWTRRGEEKQQQREESIHNSDIMDVPMFFDVLLVDPPRQGLDDHVCQMALTHPTLEDFLYISCGHRALLKDLERLNPMFEVIHCVQMDLFPRTDSIETLVHLRRRRVR
jgi:tRNA/tmRNA/rRNA uracil-C5-methylase (TrmA/RlmC/RlmD family)